jgi:hypothetical protein
VGVGDGERVAFEGGGGGDGAEFTESLWDKMGEWRRGKKEGMRRTSTRPVNTGSRRRRER